MTPRPFAPPAAARFVAAILFAAILLCPALLLSARQAKRKPDEPPQIKVQVQLVGVVASVQTADGRPVSGLAQESFEVLEEGVSQKIEAFEANTQQPLDMAVMIDTSASTFRELHFVREAAARFLRQVVRPVDRVGVFQFADSVEQLSSFTGRIDTLENSLAGLQVGSGTVLYDALVIGSGALGKRPPSRRRVILLITDAGESTSRTKFEDARHAAILSEAMLYTVLIRPVKNESGRNTAGEHALINIAEATGGALYTVDETSEFAPTFDRIDKELRTQYVLGYYPTPRPPAGAFRKLELRVKPAAGGQTYTVRHRRGYFTAE